MSTQEEFPVDDLARLRLENQTLRQVCEAGEEANRLLAQDLETQAVKLRAAWRQIADLKARLDDEAGEGEYSEEVRELWNYWRAVAHPRARKLKDDRARPTRQRLKAGWTVHEIKQAIVGAFFGAPISPDGSRNDDLEQVVRNEITLRRNLQRFTAAIERQPLSKLLTLFCLSAGITEPRWSVTEQAWQWKCPVCRFQWHQDSFYPLFGWKGSNGRPQLLCRGGCGELSEQQVREALLSAPFELGAAA